MYHLDRFWTQNRPKIIKFGQFLRFFSPKKPKLEKSRVLPCWTRPHRIYFQPKMHGNLCHRTLDKFLRDTKNAIFSPKLADFAHFWPILRANQDPKFGHSEPEDDHFRPDLGEKHTKNSGTHLLLALEAP